MKGFITLTNVYQDAPTVVNVANINYFYRQDAGLKHTVIICTGSEHGLSVQEDYEQILKLIEGAADGKGTTTDRAPATPAQNTEPKVSG